MLKALSKSRSANFYANQVKVLLLIVIGVLIYNSNDARFFISDQLNNASEMIRPDAQFNFRYWSWKPSTLLTVNLFVTHDLVVLECQSRIAIIWERQPNTSIKFGHSSHPGKMISVSFTLTIDHESLSYWSRSNRTQWQHLSPHTI